MQEKIQNISSVKQRILQFVDSLGISKREFYKKIGVSRGTLESKTGITEEIVAKFIAKYPDVNLEWLIKGQGDVYNKKETVTQGNVSLNVLMMELIKDNGNLREEIGWLKKEIEILKSFVNKKKDEGIDIPLSLAAEPKMKYKRKLH